MNPVKAMNLLVDSNPDLELRDLMSQPALQVFKAVLKLMTCPQRMEAGSQRNLAPGSQAKH
jgi:hypothetical protein